MSNLGLFCKKIGCSAIFDQNTGYRSMVTLLDVLDAKVLKPTSSTKSGAKKFLVGFNAPGKVKKPQKDLCIKLGVKPMSKYAEFLLPASLSPSSGSSLSSSLFKEGDYVDISGVSKGKGFAGVMKRHNFSGLRASHGVSIAHRSQGSTGQCQDPGKVFKGKKMAGRLGGGKVTVQNLQIASIQDSLIVVYGAAPGPSGSLLFLKNAVKKKRAVF